MDTPARTLAVVALALAVGLAGCSVLGPGETPERVTMEPTETSDGGGGTASTPTPTPTPTSRSTTTPASTPTPSPEPTPTPHPGTGVVVLEVSPAGETLNDEYVVFGNAGDLALDLSGWRVRDLDGDVHEFSDGVAIAPGETLTLHSGRGTQDGSHRYWWADAEVWDDRGDTIYVYDETGQKVFEYSY